MEPIFIDREVFAKFERSLNVSTAHTLISKNTNVMKMYVTFLKKSLT